MNGAIREKPSKLLARNDSLQSVKVTYIVVIKDRSELNSKEDVS